MAILAVVIFLFLAAALLMVLYFNETSDGKVNDARSELSNAIAERNAAIIRKQAEDVRKSI